jgi:hypothetical protein
VSSTKTPGAKRATLLRASDYTKSFAKDWVRLTHSGRFNMKQLKEAMLLLIANDGPPATGVARPPTCRRMGGPSGVPRRGRFSADLSAGDPGRA